MYMKVLVFVMVASLLVACDTKRLHSEKQLSSQNSLAQDIHLKLLNHSLCPRMGINQKEVNENDPGVEIKTLIKNTRLKGSLNWIQVIRIDSGNTGRDYVIITGENGEVAISNGR